MIMEQKTGGRLQITPKGLRLSCSLKYAAKWFPPLFIFSPDPAAPAKGALEWQLHTSSPATFQAESHSRRSGFVMLCIAGGATVGSTNLFPARTRKGAYLFTPPF